MSIVSKSLQLCLSGLLLISGSQIYAHGGKTDSNGGHYNRKAGVYHYHNGSSSSSSSTYTKLSYRSPSAYSSSSSSSSTTKTYTPPTKTKQNEAYYQRIAASLLKGQAEVTMGDRTRCDIVTSEYAIEVDFKKEVG